ncbi:ThiF family protein [Gillisia sp. Hel_I_86]|uniref:ThiF family adenylyltransferase n=1 Tax=Gillisia sp. Hel_I_86 TaxID=1249981 RepID=UPI00119B80AE|nr:ThiF family adenylyltransferase [Gillisia sp. Hel_I_86]TVZ26101.1 ThiF family protein [Gillisia sp. Hel_I_86]
MDVFYWNTHPAYKNLYEAELGLLKRGLGGKFKLLELLEPPKSELNKVSVLGLLKFGNSSEQHVLVVFPTKYPYAPPKVKAVSLAYTPDGTTVSQIIPKLFGKGNQYNDGALCLFQQGFWNSNEHNVGWLLRRAQKWLISVNSPQGFKPEEIVEENPSPLQNIGQVIIPKEIHIPKNLKTGEFTLTQFKPNYYILEQNVLSEPPFYFQLNKEVFRWYGFEKHLSFKKLFPAITAQAFIDIFKQYFGENLIEKSQTRNVAFYLPGDVNPWHFFKLVITVNGPSVNIQPNYYIGRNVASELYLRTKDLFDDKILSKKRITIIGLGAIGSEVALSLAKNGIGHFNLFDSDIFEIGNSVRHAADLFYIGEDKVSVMKRLIRRSNPNITVNSYKTDILDDSGLLEESLSKSDLCIVLTAEESVDYLINDRYITNFGVPFVFARVSEGALSGSIQVVSNDSACLRCLSLRDKDFLPTSSKKISFQELMPEYGSCSNPAVPGSEIDTKEISLQVARISLQLLLKDKNKTYPELKHRQFYWHGPFGSDSNEPFTWERRNYKKHPKCSVCN